MAPFESVVFPSKITCGECKKSCKGQAVRLNDKFFHVKCFKCKECHKVLGSGGFYSKDDQVYCADDYQRLFGTKCAECGKNVEGEVVTALGNTYHQHCFHCTKCRNKFAAGDKVTFTGQDYLCSKCLDKYERSMAESVKASSPTKKSPTREAVEQPVSPEKIVPVQATREHSSLITSTPAKPQRAQVDGYISPTADHENSHISESGDGVYHNGALSPISLSSEDSFSPSVRSPEDENDDVFTFITPADLESNETSSQEKGRLSPGIQQIVLNPATNRWYITWESTGSYEPKYDVDYGRFYKQSYLKPQPKPYMRGPSINPPDKPVSPKSHFHRPENFSYTQVRRDYIKPMKKESSRDTDQMSKRKMEAVVPMNSEEPIELSKIPDAHKENERTAPIERDDWPSPPAPAAAYPELLRDHSLPRGKSQEDMAEPEPSKPDPRIQRDIDELSKIPDSGVGKCIMKTLERKAQKSPTLDPRSASRTPSASKEPAYKTRYESPVFASPSRDLDHRYQPHHAVDDEYVKYRNTTLPATNFPAPKPGYGLGGTKSATLPARAGSYDPYEMYSEHNKENGDPMETRSHHTSRSSVEDEFDPETGLRRSRWRSSGNNFKTMSYMTYRRSMPSMLKSDEPPKLYPYEQLLVGNYKLPPGTDRNTLEMHLSKEEFESIFHLRREEFYRLAEWKRNDLKKRVGLY